MAVFKAILVSLAAILGLSALYIQTATPPPGSVLMSSVPVASTSEPYQVWLLNWGFHTSILVESPANGALESLGEGARYLEYSWGDRRFYRDQDHSLGSMLAAVAVPTSSVVHVRGWSQPPDQALGVRQRYRRWVDALTLYQLIVALESSIPRTPEGQRVMPYPTQAGQVGTFYPGREHYILWFTCNTWTVQRLAQAGLAHANPAVVLAEQVPMELKGFVKKYN